VTRAARFAVLLAAACLLGAGAPASAQGRGGQPGPPPTARAAAVVDLTGYWVALVTEDWRYRMVTPAKGDYTGVPMNQAAAKVADAWDPAADEKAGLQCRSYGAAAIMRAPTRIRVSWLDDQALELATDAGMQTRVFRFGAPAGSAERSWQGDSSASWQPPRAARGRGAAGSEPVRTGSLKVVTTNLRSGYLRKNGVPYSENATVTEYYSVARLRTGAEIMVVTTVVDDPAYLTQPFIISSQFRKQADGAGWDPTPCSAHW
jgi:hypothetical protein